MTFLLCDPGWFVQLDVQNKWEENIRTYIVTCQASTREWNYLVEVYWPCAGGVSSVNAIGHATSSYSFWTSSSLDVPAGVTQEEGRTGFFIHLLSAVGALIFLARRIQPFLSLVDREVEYIYIYCVLTI